MSGYIDRGAKKWSMAMMLPEHVELLRKLEYEMTKVEKPILDQQEIEEVEATLSEAITSNSLVEFTYWKEGFILTKKGFVRSCDLYQKVFKLIDEEGIPFSIKFECTLRVSIAVG
ncbi:hypothetical protein BKP35_09020 [Anaerobacillus arseniciselenatis]|uniref:YolD-like family protein n=1 Tax=Anaerobacillus arseniciselenatis TaxID=85682 RepID=A0A1S2LLV7_9BACI|nr:YolD-like family protein [Anaerobacillus arseniciselenatis]OIJ13366.1 hypothetical protein BKP35_09020 [Anaerobacillus arseniciselenatis]